MRTLSMLLGRWQAARAHRPWLPALLLLLVLNLGYFVWSQGASATGSERPPAEVNATSIVVLTPEEGQRRQAQAQAQAQVRTRAAPAPDMLVEFEAAPAKEIPPDR